MQRITIIGAGNIGMSIAKGLSSVSDTKIMITRKSGNFHIEETVKFDCLSDNKQAVSRADIVIVAVQPGQINELFSEIKEVLTQEQLLISVASGVSIQEIETLTREMPIARAMPNTAISIGQSMTCLAFNKPGLEYEALVKRIFSSLGMTLNIPESKFAEATVLCGSGTALALKFIRAFMQAGIQNGFNEKDALMIASQVLKGASMMIEQGDGHPESLIDKVTTPGGCTIAALTEMEHAGFSSALLKAIAVGIEKARKLYSKIFSS